MKKLIVILLLLISVKSFTQSYNNNARVFNVKMFGARGDGVTNDGPAIQAAINALDAAGGAGKVWLPAGIYIDSDTIRADCKCQIIIPRRLGNSVLRNDIIIEGESISLAPGGGGLFAGDAALPPTTGSQIYSTLTTFAGAGSAIIGSASGGYNLNGFQVKNIGLRVKNNPSGTGPVVGGINWQNGSNHNFENVQVFIDTSGWRSTAAVNDVTGIETPDNSSGENYSISNCVVQGFRSGFKIGEHVVLNNANAMACYYGFHIKYGQHSLTSLRVGAYWCAYDIYVSGSSILSSFKMDTEWQQAGKWYDDIATIKDSANLVTGQVFYTIVEMGVGKNNSKFIKSGGTGLNTITDDAGVAPASASAGVTIGNLVTSGTTGSVLYVGSNSYLQQSNSNFFYDSTNNRLGIGTTTPVYPIDVKTAAPFIRSNTSNTSVGGFLLGKQDVNKWGWLLNQMATPISDISLYDYTKSKTRIYADTSGNLNLGGAANVTATSAIAIDNSNNVSFDNGAFNYDAVNHRMVTPNHYGVTSSGGNVTLSSTTHATKGKIYLGSAQTSYWDEANTKFVITPTASTDGISVVGSNAGRVSIVAQNTNSAGNTSFYFQNERGGYVSYGGIGQGGSTFGGSWFGSSRSDRTFLIADGANSTGLLIGTLQSTNLILGTLNAAAITVSTAQAVRFNAYGAGTATFDASGNITSSAAGQIAGTATNNNATAGNVGEEVNAIVSTYTNYTTTATYQNVTSITLTAGDWDISAFMTYSANSSTITAAGNAIFVISTTTASAAGATEGKNIAYIPQAALLGTSLFSESISPYRVSIAGSTTYYLNTQATFTLGNPQYVGGLHARRMR